jgi:hypothetical protein
LPQYRVLTLALTCIIMPRAFPLMQCFTLPPEEPHPKLYRMPTYARVIIKKETTFVILNCHRGNLLGLRTVYVDRIGTSVPAVQRYVGTVKQSVFVMQ